MGRLTLRALRCIDFLRALAARLKVGPRNVNG